MDSTEDQTPERRDRDEIYLEYTKSICPICKDVVDGQVNVRDNKVFLRKRRPEHGTFEALVLACGIDPPAAVDALAEKAFMIVIQDFLDPYTFNVKQVMKCCVTEITPDGRLIPFCAYNSVGYREEVRAALSGAPVPTVVPNAGPLQPLLVRIRFGSQTVAGTDTDGASRPSRDATNVGRRLRP